MLMIAKTANRGIGVVPATTDRTIVTANPRNPYQKGLNF
jgi:hypothetical protein